MNKTRTKRRVAALGIIAMTLCAISGATEARPDGTPPTAVVPAPLAQTGNTAVLWIESAAVHAAWQGEDLKRIVDEQTGAPCLEWHQDPALRGKATFALPGVDLADYDAGRFQWKYMGGGSLLQVQVGRLNWYLNKERYKPNEWQLMC